MVTRVKGTHSKYRDQEDGDSWMPHVHQDKRYSPRAFTPSDNEHDDGAGQSKLIVDSFNGDWSWKPERDALLRKRLDAARRKDPDAPDNFVTFRGVPPSAAELYRSTMHQPG